ncbi:MAG: MMPL family transporter [bacterium]|nr:MMPL family transporter [bacterium]
MFLPTFSIHRPVAATMLVAVFVVFGVIGLGRLGVSLFPNVDYPIVSVRTDWEHARPEEVDNDVTDALEDAVSGVSGIKHITSQSSEGRSTITIEFELDKDIDVAAQEVRDKVSSELDELPREAELPTIEKQDANAQSILMLAITGQYAVEDLTRIAQDHVRPMIQKIAGVGEVPLRGDRRMEVHIRLYREKLAAYGIGVNQVIDAVRAQHVQVPGGKVETSAQEFSIRTLAEFPTPEAFNSLIVANWKGAPIRIRDIGYSIGAREEDRGASKISTDGVTSKTVSLGVNPRTGANEVAIANKVKALLPDIRRSLPEGVSIQISVDRTHFIEQSIREVEDHLIIGGICAALVIFFFLQNFRTTLISAISIPVSILATFACMYALGFTMNNMTMLGLVVAVGIVIDDSIVMVENIFRHRRELKKTAMQAALDGSSEIAFAVVAATMVLAGVFLPVAFMGSMTGRFFYQFAITVAFSVAISMLVALTLAPMLCSRMLRLQGHTSVIFMPFEWFMAFSVRVYRILLRFCLRYRFIVILLAAAAMGGGWMMYERIGKEFITAEDQSRFLIRVVAPLSYSPEKTETVMDRIRSILNSIPEVQIFYSFVGAGGSNKGFAYVTLVPKSQRERSQFDIQSLVRQKLKSLPDVRASVTDLSPLGGRSRNEDIQLAIQGPSIEEIDKYSEILMDRISETPGYIGVTRDLEIGKPEVRVLIDRDKAADAGVEVSEVARAVGALMGGAIVGEYKEGGKSYDIRVRLDEQERLIPEDIERIYLKNSKGELVDAAGIVRLEEGVGPSVITRLDRQRSATIYANLEGKVLGDALEEVRAMANEVLPEGYNIKFGGRAESYTETGDYVVLAFVLSIILTYMILAAQFESFVYPFSIMMGLPLSFVGAFGLLLALGNTLNLFSMIGMILLVGLATKNGILLVEYANQLRDKGLSINEALIESGATRLRPILMTAVSTIAGVIPVVIGLGEGSESRQPMGVAISGGMISSTFLTLLVVPVVYSYLDQFTRWRFLQFLKRGVFVDD